MAKRASSSLAAPSEASATLARHLLEEASTKPGWSYDLAKSRVGKKILKLPKPEQCDVATALFALISSRAIKNESDDWYVISRALQKLLARKLPFSAATVHGVLAWLGKAPLNSAYHLPLAGMTKMVETFASEHTPDARLTSTGIATGTRLTDKGRIPQITKYGKRIQEALGDTSSFTLVDRDLWAGAASEDLRRQTPTAAKAWAKLLSHCEGATAAKPSAKWLKTAAELVTDIGDDAFSDHAVRWFDLAEQPSTRGSAVGRGHFCHDDPMAMVDHNQTVLKGLAWCCQISPTPDLTRALGSLCVSAFKKLGGIGARAPRLGNACIHVLGSIGGEAALAQLALLKVKVKNRSLQNQIAKALGSAAEREGVTPEELEEMSVPDYGLEGEGVLNRQLGDFTARLAVDGTNSVSLTWLNADGKEQKSVPAEVKKSHAEVLKELRATAKDIKKMLPAISQRIDNLFLHQRNWPFDAWRERYLEHPLVGTLARRLIWQFSTGKKTRTAIDYDGSFVGHDGGEIDQPTGKDTVRLWHPLDADPKTVLRWRHWLEEHLVSQPFKQAHREVYLVTDAERYTGSYSNRYASHIIKQHQFNALCLARNWRNSLRLMVDDDYTPPSRDLPEWSLRAEFWVEGAGDHYGTDTTEAGTYLYLATDQVRFYPIDAEENSAHASGGGYGQGWGRNRGTGDPLPIDDVPPLVFSEIMRDVDLFVGVASVGNDPTWADGGAGGHHQTYWQDYSFGDLSATATTRKETLERLLPKLKIAEQLSIDGKFLVVKGSLRTYKIHLGSGNILMEPDDQYLCIVQQSSARRGTNRIFLPFEGDNRMAVILSKAFLLADDQKITDPTIVSQITPS